MLTDYAIHPTTAASPYSNRRDAISSMNEKSSNDGRNIRNKRSSPPPSLSVPPESRHHYQQAPNSPYPYQSSPMRPPTPLTPSSSLSTKTSYSLFEPVDWYSVRHHSVCVDGSDFESAPPLDAWRRSSASTPTAMQLCMACRHSQVSQQQACGHPICSSCQTSFSFQQQHMSPSASSSTCPMCVQVRDHHMRQEFS